MWSTTVYITPAQHEALKAISDRTGAPMAVYIRQALDLIIAAQPAPVAAPLSLVGGGQ